MLVALAALSGCDVPTAVPSFDVRWVFPIEETSISVADLIPANVAITGTNFSIAVDPVVLVQTLGGICAPCGPLDGLSVPMPAFNVSYQRAGSLGADVVSANLVSGSLSLAIQNDLGFDPLNPAIGATGTLTVTIHDVDAAGPVIGQVVLDGATSALPNGSLTIVPLALTPGTVTSAFVALVDLDAPAGVTNVLIDINAGLEITATPLPLLVSSATLNVDGKAVSLPQTSLDVSGVAPDLVDYIQSGSLLVDVQNPFGVAIGLMLEIGGPGITTLQRNLDIGSGPTSSVTLTYTGADLRSFIGKPGVYFLGTGTVTSPGTTVTVTATQQATIETSLDLMVEVGLSQP